MYSLSLSVATPSIVVLINTTTRVLSWSILTRSVLFLNGIYVLLWVVRSIFVALTLAVFKYAEVFNQDVSKWNVAKVIIMGQMFVNAYAFTQSWCENNWETRISDADFACDFDKAISVSDFAGAGTGKVLCCSIGEFYNSTAFECESCPIGQYNDLTHVTDQLPLSCESCPRNKFAPIAGLPECSDCEEDQYR